MKSHLIPSIRCYPNYIPKPKLANALGVKPVELMEAEPA